eukprot:m.33407 g.33407  ORF g.33407 m.33407 type:complete len:204 (+) comp7186_c0_seq2:1765-2376(+)
MDTVPSFPEAASGRNLPPPPTTVPTISRSPSPPAVRSPKRSKAPAKSRASPPKRAATCREPAPAGKKVARRRKRPDNSPDAVLDEKLKSLFSIEQMQADTAEWNAVLEAHALTKAELDRLVVLRRRAKSCLYAEKSRNKQLTQLQQAELDNAELRSENSGLRDKNTELNRTVDALQSRLRQLTALLEREGAAVPDLDDVLANM